MTVTLSYKEFSIFSERSSQFFFIIDKFLVSKNIENNKEKIPKQADIIFSCIIFAAESSLRFILYFLRRSVNILPTLPGRNVYEQKPQSPASVPLSPFRGGVTFTVRPVLRIAPGVTPNSRLKDLKYDCSYSKP